MHNQFCTQLRITATTSIVESLSLHLHLVTGTLPGSRYWPISENWEHSINVRCELKTWPARLLTILCSVKACEWGPEHLHEVTHAAQMLVHVPEVGVDMVAIPEKQQPERSDDYSPLVTKGGQS